MIVRENGVPNAESGLEYSEEEEEEDDTSAISMIEKEGMIQRLQDSDDKRMAEWSVKIFEEPNPIVSRARDGEYSRDPFKTQSRYGYHLVVVASPDANKTLATIERDQWLNALVTIQDRLRWLYAKRGVSYIAVYADHNKVSGSLDETHPHFNIVTFPTVPPTINDELKAQQKSQEKLGICPVCHATGEEGKDRVILRTDNFVSYCPWSSLYQYEFCIAPNRHHTSFVKTTQTDLKDLALMIRATLGGLMDISPDASYSVVFCLSSETRLNGRLHWHIRVCPVIKPWSGMERGFGIHVNDIGPEDAAQHLRAACRREFGRIAGVT